MQGLFRALPPIRALLVFSLHLNLCLPPFSHFFSLSLPFPSPSLTLFPLPSLCLPCSHPPVTVSYLFLSYSPPFSHAFTLLPSHLLIPHISHSHTLSSLSLTLPSLSLTLSSPPPTFPSVFLTLLPLPHSFYTFPHRLPRSLTPSSPLLTLRSRSSNPQPHTAQGGWWRVHWQRATPPTSL